MTDPQLSLLDLPDDGFTEDPYLGPVPVDDPVFDLPAARAARDEGIARVDGNVHQQWKDVVDRTIKVFADSGTEFTSDDIRAWVTSENCDCPPAVSEPHHHNAWGARFVAARKAGLIEKVGHRESARPAGHARTVAVWRGVGT